MFAQQMIRCLCRHAGDPALLSGELPGQIRWLGVLPAAHAAAPQPRPGMASAINITSYAQGLRSWDRPLPGILPVVIQVLLRGQIGSKCPTICP